MLKSYISSFPIGPETGASKKAMDDYVRAVEVLRTKYEKLPRHLKLLVRQQFRSIFLRPNRFLRPAAFEKEPIEKCLLSFEASSRRLTATDSSGQKNKSNSQAIAIVDFCRAMWRKHKGREPPLQVAHADTFNRTNPFTAFVADMMKSEGVSGEAHTAVRAWRRTMHKSDKE